MEYLINWLPSSEYTYIKEMEFILEKWNLKEVDKFTDLVEKTILKLSKNSKIGIYRKDMNTYSLVISKQTTLFYDILENKSQIDLIAFWNNKQNPKYFDTYIKLNL